MVVMVLGVWYLLERGLLVCGRCIAVMEWRGSGFYPQKGAEMVGLSVEWLGI